MYKHVLVPIDGSETARLGLEEAIKLAKALNAGIRLIYVVNKLPWVSPGVSAEMVRTLIDDLRGNGESVLHGATTAARDAGIAVDSRLIEALGSEAGESIVKEAVSWPADLIVCGTHGRRGVRRILMGSDAEYILRHSPVPVLMTRNPTVSDR
jgi:nucleotide-binding universal stress UspA family protein